MPHDALQQLESCPEKEHLREFLLGKISESDISVFESHISDCPACEDTIRGLNTSDTLVAIAGNAFENILDESTSGTADQQLVDQLIDQMKSHQGNRGIDAEQHQLESRSAEVTRLLTPVDDDQHLGTLAHYRVIRILGAGSTGVVYQALDQKLDRSVALKVLRPSLGEAAKERFLAEARLAASIDHPNVITIYEVGDEAPLAFMAMQWVPGETLQDRLQRQPIMTEPQAIELGQQIAAGLAAAHAKNLIHRDIKPANIWMTDDGDQARILDFGLARIADDDPQMTATGMLAGTPNFMSPEQTRGQELDGRSDLFSLGCVLYCAATGRLPFGGNGILATLQSIQADHPRPPIELNPNLSDEFSNTISCLLEKQPINRPRSARELENGIKSPPLHWQSSAVPAVSNAAKTKPQVIGFKQIATAVGLILLGWAGWMFAPQIIRIATDKGELVIETMDDSIEVQILKNGKEIALLDTKTQQRIDIKSGTYDIQVKDSKNRFNITPNQVVMSRGSKQLVSIKRITTDSKMRDSSSVKDATSELASGDLKSDDDATPTAPTGWFPKNDPVSHDANRQYLTQAENEYRLNTLLYAARNWHALSRMNDGENRVELFALEKILDRIYTMQTAELQKRYVYEKAVIENDAQRLPSLLRSYRDDLAKIKKLKLNPEDLRKIEAVIEANTYPLLARAEFVKKLTEALDQYEQADPKIKESLTRINARELVFALAASDESRINLLKFSESLQQNVTQDKPSLDILAFQAANWERLNPGARSEDTFSPRVKLGLSYLEAQSKLSSLLFETRKLGAEHRTKLLLNQELALQWSNWVVYEDLQSRIRGEQPTRQFSASEREAVEQGNVGSSETPIYKGQTFEQWLDVLKKERDKAAIADAIDATAELSRDNPAKQRIFVDDVLRPLVREYGGPSYGDDDDDDDDDDINRHLVESFRFLNAEQRVEFLLDEIANGNGPRRSPFSFLINPIAVSDVVDDEELKIHREFRRLCVNRAPELLDAALKRTSNKLDVETESKDLWSTGNFMDGLWGLFGRAHLKYYSSLSQDEADPIFQNTQIVKAIVEKRIAESPDNLALRIIATRMLMNADPQPEQLQQLGNWIEDQQLPKTIRNQILRWTESVPPQLHDAKLALMLRLLENENRDEIIGMPGVFNFGGDAPPVGKTLQDRALMIIYQMRLEGKIAKQTLRKLEALDLNNSSCLSATLKALKEEVQKQETGSPTDSKSENGKEKR